MSIAGCVLNTKPAVKKQPSKPFFVKQKTKSHTASARGLVQRLRLLTAMPESYIENHRDPHARMIPASNGTNEEQTTLSDHPPVLLLGSQSAKFHPKRKQKLKPKRKVRRPAAAKSLIQAIDDSAQIEEEMRLQELFQRKTQERVASALRAKKKELQKQQEQRTLEGKKSGSDTAILMKKVRVRICRR